MLCLDRYLPWPFLWAEINIKRARHDIFFIWPNSLFAFIRLVDRLAARTIPEICYQNVHNIIINWYGNSLLELTSMVNMDEQTSCHYKRTNFVFSSDLKMRFKSKRIFLVDADFTVFRHFYVLIRVRSSVNYICRLE